MSRIGLTGVCLCACLMPPNRVAWRPNRRRQLASKTNEVVALQKELERRATQVGQVQAEAERQAAAIRDLTDKLRKAQDAPRNDKAKASGQLGILHWVLSLYS